MSTLRPRRLTVKMMTDASWSEGNAGFGWSFKSELHMDGGGISGTVNYVDPTHTELAGACAVCRAAVLAHKKYAVPLKLDLTCDNTRAIGLLLRVGAVRGSGPPMVIEPVMDVQPHELALLQWLARNIVNRHMLVVRWIRAHVSERTRLTAIHAFTDREAKKARWNGFLERSALSEALPT